MYTLDKLTVFVDLSTHCNALCPQCHRTDHLSMTKQNWLPLIQWSIEDFKHKFPLNIIECIQTFHICGTWGEPFMNKDIYKIVKYIVDNSDARIELNTNGSIRSKKWWYEFGKLSNNIDVTFDVDGITQEMHEKYRVGTNLNKILENMESFSLLNINARAFTVLFKHNELYIDAIRELCKQYGANDHYFIHSNRFEKNSYLDYIYKGHMNRLEEANGYKM